MEKLFIILIVVFICLLVVLPISMVLCHHYIRYKKPETPKKIRRNLLKVSKLRVMKYNGGIGTYNDNTRDHDCSICQSSISTPQPFAPDVPSPNTKESSEPLPTIPETAKLPPPNSQEPQDHHHRLSVTNRHPTDLENPRLQKIFSPTEVLMLNTCKHEFHGECLKNWYLAGRYDCPNCRRGYQVGLGKVVGRYGEGERTKYVR